MRASALGLSTLGVFTVLSVQQALPQTPRAPNSLYDDNADGLRGTSSGSSSTPPDVSSPDSEQATGSSTDATTSDPLAGASTGRPQPSTAPTSTAPTSTPAINYGKPTPKKPLLFTPKSPLYQPDPNARPLPPLVPYATKGQKRPSKSGPDANASPGPTVAVLPSLPVPQKPKPDPYPFAPIGIDAGSLRLLPFVELGGGYDSNPNRISTGVKGSSYARVDGGLDVNSQWSNHSLTATLRGGYSDFFDFHQADRPDLQGKVNGRIDVTRDTQIETEARFTLDTQQPGSQQLAVPGATFIVGRPLIESYGGTLGVAQHFDRLTVRLRGTIDRFQYEDAELSDGSELLLSRNDYNDYGVNAHISYELKPGLIPYLDVTADQRDYDSAQDSEGYDRTSKGIAAKLGSTFELTPLITGDLAGGYFERNYADSRLMKAAGPTVDGSVVWAPSALTKVTLNVGTDFVETTLAGATGALSRRVGLQLSHMLFRNFTLTGIGTYQINNYQGESVTEHLYTGSLLAEYNLTRDIVLRATYRHERFLSSLASNYTADAFLLGVRLQR